MLHNYFYNPEIAFEYVNDATLWEKIFREPFPKDLTDTEKGMIKLNEYFTIKTKGFSTEKGLIVQKILLANERFHSADRNEKSDAFLALCDFLIRYKRPYRDCYVQVPKHPTIKKNSEFSPLDIYYKQPVYPKIDRERNMLEIRFNDQLFLEVYKYCFGDLKKINYDTQKVLFPFGSFCGFMLQY